MSFRLSVVTSRVLTTSDTLPSSISPTWIARRVSGFSLPMRSHLTLIPACLNICRLLFPYWLGVPVKEVAKGLEFKRLNKQDPILAEGLLLEHAPFYNQALQFCIPPPPRGYIEQEYATEDARLRRCVGASFVQPASRSLDEVVPSRRFWAVKGQSWCFLEDAAVKVTSSSIYAMLWAHKVFVARQ